MTEPNNVNVAGSFAKSGKRLGIIGVAALALIGAQLKFNIIPMRASQKAVVPQAVDLPTDAISIKKVDVAQVALPSTALEPKCQSGSPIRIETWAWNAHMGAFFANGGPKTTSGSLVAKHGVCVDFTRQDDTEKSKPELIKFAQLLAKGDPNPNEGIQFLTVMGDGAAMQLAGLNKVLAKLGPDYKAEIVGAVGYSRGEDAFMGPAAWKDSPESAKGGLVAGVLRDGDWNIAQYWAAQNNIPNNPDEHYYDPNALNWYSADDYLKAAEAYTTGSDPTHGVCEDRIVIKDGKTTSQKAKVCVQGVVTWTPGDVNIAKQKGGLVKVLSTKENRFQMPCVIIGIHKWNVAHTKQVEGMLAAFYEGADQVSNYDQALQRAGKASYAIYNEETPAYWVKYYKGVKERDKAQQPVELGGSTVMNLADNLVLFGLTDDQGDPSSSMFRATYEGFGNIAKQQYPNLVPDFPKTSEAVNVMFLKDLAATMPHAKADLPTYDSGDITDVVAKKDWSIQFETGKADLSPVATTTLEQIYNNLVVGGLSVELDGHTDNTGSPDVNLNLSKARAESVKQWLLSKNATMFPDSRVNVVGFGDSKPVAPNSTPDGRAKNRRVTIVLGTK